MLNGRLIIDGAIDAYAEYGMYVKDGGLGKIIQWPEFKNVYTYDWHEENGIDVDLDNPVFTSRKVQMAFYVKYVRDAEDLFAMLCDGVYHSFYFPRLSLTLNMRLLNNGSFALLYDYRTSTLTLTFQEDNPAPADTYNIGQNPPLLVRDQGYQIDNVNMACLGVLVLKGTDATFLKRPDVKEGLKVSVKSVAGDDYDEYDDVNLKSGNVKMNLLIHTQNFADFTTRFNLIKSAICRSGMRSIYIPSVNSSFQCYYKSCDITRFIVMESGEVWCEFSVTFVLPVYDLSTSFRILSVQKKKQSASTDLMR